MNLKVDFDNINYEKDLSLFIEKYRNEIVPKLMKIYEKIIKLKIYMNFVNPTVLEYPFYLNFNVMKEYEYFYNYMIELMIEQAFYQKLW